MTMDAETQCNLTKTCDCTETPSTSKKMQKKQIDDPDYEEDEYETEDDTDEEGEEDEDGDETLDETEEDGDDAYWEFVESQMELLKAHFPLLTAKFRKFASDRVWDDMVKKHETAALSFMDTPAA